jgi:hypothetical protein
MREFDDALIDRLAQSRYDFIAKGINDLRKLEPYGRSIPTWDQLNDDVKRLERDSIKHILPDYESLQNRLSDIISLCWDYDGFDTVEGLKSLIDDVVKYAKGEMKVIDTKEVENGKESSKE